MDAKLRYSTQPPKDLPEQYRRMVELLPQLEPKHLLIEDVEVGMDEMAIRSRIA